MRAKNTSLYEGGDVMQKNNSIIRNIIGTTAAIACLIIWANVAVKVFKRN